MKNTTIKELEQTLSNNKLVFATFGTTWCGDCRMMEPFLIQLEKKNQEEVLFFYLDAEVEEVFRDENNKYKVLKVPTMIMFKDGIEVDRGYEFIPLKKLQK